MIEANAVVTRLDAGAAWVRVTPVSGGCGRCDEPGGCRSIGLAYALGTPDKVFRLPNPVGARVGDRVNVRIDRGAPLRGALAIYGLGVGLLIGGAAFGNAIAPAAAHDFYAVGGGLGGLVLAALLNRVLLQSRQWRRSFELELATDAPADRDCTRKDG